MVRVRTRHCGCHAGEDEKLDMVIDTAAARGIEDAYKTAQEERLCPSTILIVLLTMVETHISVYPEVLADAQECHDIAKERVLMASRQRPN